MANDTPIKDAINRGAIQSTDKIPISRVSQPEPGYISGSQIITIKESVDDLDAITVKQSLFANLPTPSSTNNGHYYQTEVGIYKSNGSTWNKVAYTSTDLDTLLATKANQSTTYTKAETNTLLDAKQATITASNGVQKVGVDVRGVDATTLAKGVVQLSNTYNGTSQILATTEKALSDGLAIKQNAITIGTAAQYFKGDLSLGNFASDAQSATVENAINSGVTNKAPSEKAVFDALALKAPLASPTFTGSVKVPTPSLDSEAVPKSYADGLQRVLSAFGRTGVVTAQSGDYSAIQITNTPAGNISATSVQAAINELDNEKQPNIGYTPENVANKENITLDTSSTKYPTNNLVKTYTDAKVEDQIIDGVTTKAPSQNAVFDALALKAPLSSAALTGTPTAPTASVGTNTTQIATTQYVKSEISSVVASMDVMVFKGVIDASASPNYPAGNAGETYRISTTGKIGGISGINVEGGDLLICLVDGSVSGDQAAVGLNWNISQVNIDGAVTTTETTTTDNDFVLFSGTSGKIVKKATQASFKALLALTKSDVGLGNVQNTDTTTTANITDSLNKRFVTDAQIIKLNNTTGVNSGDQDLSGLLTKADNLANIANQQTALNNITNVSVASTGQALVKKANGDTGFETLASGGNVSATGVISVVGAPAVYGSTNGTSIIAGTNLAAQRQVFAQAQNLIASFTTAERNTLTWASGDLIYDTTIGLYLKYTGSTWVCANVEIGDYKQSAVSSNANGWLLCNGGAISRSVYSALFAIIGTSFGAGDGSTTFNLPDLRGRVFGSIGQGAGLTNRALGAAAGEETVVLTLAQMPAHSHTYTRYSGLINNVNTVGGNNNSIWQSTSTQNTNSQGSGEAHNNMQPTVFGGNTFIFSGV